MISSVRVNSPSFLRSKRRIIQPGFERRKGRGLPVSVASQNGNIVVTLGQNVGQKAVD
jgi:hypothetical protein